MSLRDRFPGVVSARAEYEDVAAVDSEMPTDYLRSSLHQGFRRFEPDVTFVGHASVRLSGDHFRANVFDEVAAQAFIYLQQEIVSAAPTKHADSVRIGFRAIAPGSVIMPLEPIAADIAASGEVAASGASPLEHALVRVLDVHDAFEMDDPNRAATRANNDMLKRLRQLVTVLDQANANFEVDLSRYNGRRRRSVISEKGRSAAKSWFDSFEKVEERQISGVLAGVAVASSGLAKVDLRSGNRRPEIVDVPVEVAKRLPWDTMLRFNVRTTFPREGSGRPKSVNEFVELLPHDVIFGG